VLASDPVIHEPRLPAATRSRLNAPNLAQLRTPAPDGGLMQGQSSDPNRPANQIGVPVTPFQPGFNAPTATP
jgi:hypothetical protein